MVMMVMMVVMVVSRVDSFFLFLVLRCSGVYARGRCYCSCSDCFSRDEALRELSVVVVAPALVGVREVIHVRSTSWGGVGLDY